MCRNRKRRGKNTNQEDSVSMPDTNATIYIPKLTVHTKWDRSHAKQQIMETGTNDVPWQICTTAEGIKESLYGETCCKNGRWKSHLADWHSSVRQPDSTGTYFPPLTRFSMTQWRGLIPTASVMYGFQCGVPCEISFGDEQMAGSWVPFDSMVDA